MSDFGFLEDLAIQIQENRKLLAGIEPSLLDVNMRLHEIPLKRTTESVFAKMTGSSYDDRFSDLEKIKKDLEDKKQKIEQLVHDHLMCHSI